LPRFYADEYILNSEDGAVSNKTKEVASITAVTFRLTSYQFEDVRAIAP
jgi:hypothetical protein